MNFTASDKEERQTLARAATAQIDALLQELGASREGLAEDEAARRLRRFGPNRVAQESGGGVLRELARHVFNPLNGLLLTLAAASFAMSDQRSAIVISAIVVLSVLLAFVQEHRANSAAAELRAMVRTHASVRRPIGGDPFVEISLEELAPGDIVRLTAGDMIPADVRLIATKDLFINQSALTGKSMPVEKFAAASAAADPMESELPRLHGLQCFERLWRGGRCRDGRQDGFRPDRGQDRRRGRAHRLRRER